MDLPSNEILVGHHRVVNPGFRARGNHRSKWTATRIVTGNLYFGGLQQLSSGRILVQRVEDRRPALETDRSGRLSTSPIGFPAASKGCVDPEPRLADPASGGPGAQWP